MTLAANIAALPNGDDAPVYACRAWVNFDGTFAFSGTTQYSPTDNPTPINNSGNISSIEEKGTGDHLITFSEPMPHANYCVAGKIVNNTYSVASDNSIRTVMVHKDDRSVNKVRVFCKFANAGNTGTEEEHTIMVTVFC